LTYDEGSRIQDAEERPCDFVPILVEKRAGDILELDVMTADRP